MKRTWNTILNRPTFWSGALMGCLLAVLTLAAVSVYAQSGGDVPPQDGRVEETSGAHQTGDSTGDLPPAGSTTSVPPDSPAPAPQAQPQAMFSPSDFAPLAATAAITSTITYQGLLEQDGEPANGSFDFRFRLFDDLVAGSQLGEQLASAIDVQDGHFTANLNFGADAFSGQAVWLEIAVRTAGGGAYETLAPRQAVTAAPLALSLPNVSTNPETGYVSIGAGKRISGYQFLGINAPINDWVGMYVTGGGDLSRPFYGYTTDDEGSYEFAWTEYNGGMDEWQLHTINGNVFSVNNSGDVRQPASANGLVKASAYVECWPDPAFLTVYSSFNSITGAPVTAEVGPAQGQCYIDFGFDLTGRFFSASAVQAGDVRGVTCDVDAGNTNRLRCMRWRVIDTGAEGWGGRVMVQVY